VGQWVRKKPEGDHSNQGKGESAATKRREADGSGGLVKDRGGKKKPELRVEACLFKPGNGRADLNRSKVGFKKSQDRGAAVALDKSW